MNTNIDFDMIGAAVAVALEEDLGAGDVTSETILPADLTCSGRFIAKQDGVVAGLEVAKAAFHYLDVTIRFQTLVKDGDRVEKGDTIALVSGRGRAVLGAERVALNFLQRMSGIATATRACVDAVADTDAVILDTRKTVPGLRYFDKWAVVQGGGRNHRYGLFDMALIKENHILAAGGITAAVNRVRANDPDGRPIEVEVTNLDELREALTLDVDRIMLDNMSLAEMGEAVAVTDGRTPLEASGNVNLQTVAGIAATGVDCISVGSLTHSVMAMDISLLLE